MVKLNPCPFCGGKAGYSRIPGEGFSILCTSCGAIAVRERGVSQDTLGNTWNTRTVRHNFSQQDNVKPCPFCASRISLGKMPGNSSILKCGKCGMMVSFFDSITLQDTANKWNRRT